MYLTFLLAEGLLHVSGVIAVVAATLTLMTLHRRAEHTTPDHAHSDLFFNRFWQFVATLVNAILFFALGAMIGTHPWDLAWYAVPALIVLMLIGRSVGVYGGSWLLAGSRWRVPLTWQHVLNAAGLKGALSVALLMLLPDDYEHRPAFICAAFALVLFTFVAHPVAARWYIRRSATPAA